MTGYLEPSVDNEDATRVRIVAIGAKAQLSVNAFDGEWYAVNEAWLDPTALRALAALALITADEIERGRPS